MAMPLLSSSGGDVGGPVKTRLDVDVLESKRCGMIYCRLAGFMYV